MRQCPSPKYWGIRVRSGRTPLGAVQRAVARPVGSVRSTSSWEDRHASLYGKLLLKKGLQDLGQDSSLTNLKFTEYNRPYLEGKLDFNISSSSLAIS